ncbi:hypothetical protein [Tellurirhabdus bombi]|uniref:hypothetical protein n=1 Tax=Tellurirhabdus bombi TaxID=2907205 RepID=UPI001F3ECD32|nr:hypothetical protein [Tellurirhabdus bombi]
MKKWLVLFLLPCSISAFGQASVAYYPWANLFTVSTNPQRLLWLDARFQTNTLFGQLNTTITPLINVKRTETYQFYVGPGIRFSPVDAALGDDFLQGYSLQIGVRVSPIQSIPNLQAAFEMSPSVESNFKSGVFYSRLGVAYVFRKKKAEL